MALTKIPSSLLDTSGGFDLQGNITLGDSEKILLGASSDLQIYHDESGGHSRIDDTGTGGLVIRGSQVLLEKYGGGYMINAVADGASELYHAGNKKFETTSTGATVTGNLAVTGDLDITGNVNSYNVTDLDVTDQTITLGAGQTEANSGGSGIIIDGSSASILWDETNTEFDINNPIHVAGGITFGTSDSTLADNNIRFKPAGAAYIDHNTTGQDINFRVSNSSSLDTIPLTVTSSGITATGLTVGSDSDITADIGRAKIGNVGFSDFAGFAHRDNASTGSYALLQYSTGETYLNAASGRDINIRINNSNVAVIKSDGKLLIGDSASHVDDLLQIETPASGGGHGIQIRRNDSNSDQGIGRIMFGNNTDTDLASIYVKTDGSTDNAAMTFNTQPNGGALTERMRVTSGGDISVGSNHGGFSGWRVMNLRGQSTGALYNFEASDGTRRCAIANSGSELRLQTFLSGGAITFEPGTGTEYMRLDGSGHLILGSNISTTESGKFNVYTDATNDAALYGYRSTSYFKLVPFLSNGAFSSLANVNDSGLFFSDNFVIAKHSSGYYGAVFHGNGSIFIGTESEANGSTGGATFSADSNNRRNLICATTSTSNLELIEFRNPNGTVGTIKSNGTSTSYNTSSDYRLKENVTYEFNALDRVTQLKPARFNFITDADTVLDGFLAHEVSSIVPEAVSGEKDETKEKEVEVTPAQYEDDGETLISEAVMETRTVPVYQGIDQSKLVPLLTKAIQELNTKLEAAEARITELEG